MNFKDFIDNSLQELHQVRQLKEEQQQGFDSLYYFWFGLVNGRFGAAEYNGIGGLGASATWGGGFFGLQRMYGLPQAMLDMFDYNGDGLIGYNDQALIREIGQLAIEIYNETGEFPPVITAADYLQNWAYYRVLYGKDFPDPNGYAGYPGSDSEVPDSLITSNTEGNSIFGWAGAQNFWRSLNLVLDKQALIEYYGQELIIKLNKDLVLPLFLLSMIYISLLIVFKKPKFLANRFYILVFLGIFTGILVYYLNEFSISLGKSNKVPLILSIWLPIIMLTSSTFVFVFDKNE